MLVKGNDKPKNVSFKRKSFFLSSNSHPSIELKKKIIVQVQFSAFPPSSPPYPSYPHLPPLISSPAGFVHVFLIDVPEKPSPLSPIIPSHLPSSYCPFVLNFNVSGYIFLLVCFVD